jgi:nitroreductase
MRVDLPVDRWAAAIAARKSRRSFAPEPVSEEALGRLERWCGELQPFPEARVALVREPVDAVAAGIIGGYGRVSGAPCYLAFIGDLGSARVQEAVGYTGEGLVLEATAMGLATCWVGGLFKPKAVSSALRLTAGESVLGISPVGHPSAKASLTDRSFKALAGSAKRKPVDRLLAGGSALEDRWRAAILAARLAPSANNRQPWRFKIEGEAVTVLVDAVKAGEKLSRRLDCGIAMLHLELGARASGLSGDWEFLSGPEVARFRLSATASSSR